MDLYGLKIEKFDHKIWIKNAEMWINCQKFWLIMVKKIKIFA